eukprot:8834364-Pyramimonas_sp.AAC.1
MIYLCIALSLETFGRFGVHASATRLSDLAAWTCLPDPPARDCPICSFGSATSFLLPAPLAVISFALHPSVSFYHPSLLSQL